MSRRRKKKKRDQAIIKININDEWGSMKHKRMVKAFDMASFIWELQHNFWRKWKHDESNFNLDNYKEALSELLYEYHINIDDLIQ